MRNNKLYKTIFNNIQIVYQESDGVPFNKELNEKLTPKVEPLASFFSIQTDEAIVMAFLIQSALTDIDIKLDALTDHIVQRGVFSSPRQ